MTSRHCPALNDLVVELARASAGFRRGLPDGVVTSLADLVRAMNCYYSNLIEGHDIHPVVSDVSHLMGRLTGLVAGRNRKSQLF